jgi:NADPH-dependent 2,4-dienoyl-CoA reductase/sulfur reductase-like enzyme/nitrite reductase/ring-hydroxylating ferredoxin subunit
MQTDLPSGGSSATSAAQCGMRHVARWTELKQDRPFRLELAGRKLILVRDGEQVHAFGAECPHAGAPLEDGAICQGRIVCPWHKASFKVNDGALLEPPALNRLTRYPAHREGDAIWVGATPLAPPDTISGKQDQRIFAIVGAGAAGTCAAATLREAGFGGEIVLVAQESGLPYDRTALSKFVVAGDMSPEDVPSLCKQNFFAERRVRVEPGTVTRLDVHARTVEIDHQRSVKYDMALVAPGGSPKKLSLPGSTLAGIHLLRTAPDAAAILDDVEPGQRAVIIGSGFIGLEVASSLRQQNLEVSVITPESIPFVRQFGPALGGMFRRLHEKYNVQFVQGNTVQFEGSTAVTAVILENGARIPADLVIIGTGIEPATTFIDGIALRDDGGIAVDRGMRAAPGLFAAGDVAAYAPPGSSELIRIEHWRVAQQQARVAAHNMLGGDEMYGDVPFFWTYHYGKRFEYLGHAQHWERILIEGRPEQQDFIALFTEGDAVVAVLACGRERETASLITLMRDGLSIERAKEIVGATQTLGEPI